MDNYVKGAKKHNIKGPLFFDGLYSDISVNIRDFYPKNRVGFDQSDGDIDEIELRKRLTHKMKILEKNKDLWI